MFELKIIIFIFRIKHWSYWFFLIVLNIYTWNSTNKHIVSDLGKYDMSIKINNIYLNNHIHEERYKIDHIKNLN